MTVLSIEEHTRTITSTNAEVTVFNVWGAGAPPMDFRNFTIRNSWYLYRKRS